MRVRAETRRLIEPLAGGRPGATVTVEPLKVGEFQVPPAYLEGAKRFTTARMLGIGVPRSKWHWIPVQAFAIRHPSAGVFLVDTGLHPSVVDKPAENLGRAVASFGKPRLAAGEDLPSRLRAEGVDPKGIRLVVMTHMHFDHTSAMSEFAGATFIVSEEEWTAASTDPRPFMRGYRPAHYDYAFDYRTLSYDSDKVTSYASFGRTFDLFGDGSVRLASTPGHTAGHQSVICRLADRDLVIAGDAVYTFAQLEGGAEPPRPVDLHNWRRSLRELQLFARNYPQAVIIPGHDPQLFDRLEKRYA
ncbi:MAG: N-acyl homoserine lactonase family protein [Solirubrobacterales bacterium]